MSAMVGLNIVIAAILAFLALLCTAASLALRRNAPLAWLASALGVATVQTLIVTFAAGSPLEFISAMALAPLGFWLANNAIHAMMPEKRWRREFNLAFAGLCAIAVALFAVGAPFFYQVLFVQLACCTAMIDAGLRIVSRLRWRVLDMSLLISVCMLAVLRIARLPLLVWYFGPDIEFTGFNGSSMELGLLAGESFLTLGIIIFVISAIIAETIETFRLQSERDGLTSLLNRRAFDALAGIPASKGGAVIFCDIDHFKLVNDRFGHQVGDDVICAFAGVVSRTGYPTGRIGGEEFALLLRGLSITEALDVAEMIRTRFHAGDIPQMPSGSRVSASFGVASFAAGTPPVSAFDRADAALYRAKREGRNRVCAENNDADAYPARRLLSA